MTAVSQVPLVGRDGEVAVLRSFVAEAAAGRGGALVVTGAPGIGKSVLLDAAAQEAADAGARVLRASGVEFEADIAFSGLNQLVLPLSQTVRALGPRRGKVLAVAFGVRRRRGPSSAWRSRTPRSTSCGGRPLRGRFCSLSTTSCGWTARARSS